MQRLEIKPLSQLPLKGQLSNELQMSQIFVLLILNPVMFSKLFIKQIFLSGFSLRWMIGILLALQGMSDEQRPVCEKTL